MTKTVTRSLATALAVSILAAAYVLGSTTATETVVTATPAAQTTKVAREKRTPAPTTVEGYARMFASIDTAEWGGADVSISHRMADGRRVWLYGDTLSGDNGFVHSTAIVQTGGSLHVSDGGVQLLPNGGRVNGREVIYWIDGVTAGRTADTLVVTAMEMSIGTASAWDFIEMNKGQSRQALVKATATGDVRFIKWLGWTATPTVGNPHLTDDFAEVGPNHYTYGGVTHNIALASGERLHTLSQNWDDDFSNHMTKTGLRYADWAPIFSSTTR